MNRYHWRSMRTLRFAAAFIVAASVAAGCNDKDDGGPGGGGGPAVAGAVIAGKVSSSKLRVFALRDNGSRGEEIGSGSTNAGGEFNFNLRSKPSGPIEIEAMDGTYISEADVSIRRTKVRLRMLIPSVPAGGETGLVASPLTTFAAARAMKRKEGIADLKEAIERGDDDMRKIFGIAGGKLRHLVPDIKSTGDAAAAAVVLGGLEDLAIKKSKEAADVVTALAEDLSDGIPDGKKDETPVRFEGTTEIIPPTLGTSDFLASVTSYTDPNNDKTDRGVDPPPVDAAALESVREGVGEAAPTSAGLNVGSSGAITTLAFDGKQVVYVAARDNGIKAVDISNPLAPVVDPLTSLNTKLRALPDDPADLDDGPLASVGGVLAVPGAATPQVLLFDYEQSRVVLVDVRAQTIVRDVGLAGMLTVVTSFSGGSAFISGGIPDPTRGVVWLAAKDNETDDNGYIPFNTSTFELQPGIKLQNDNIIPENIGGDVSSNLLFAPNYGPFGSGGALELVMLDQRKSFVLEDADFQALFAVKTNPSDASGSPFGIVDGGAFDSILKIGVLTGEVRGQVALINLKDLGRFTFTSGATPTGNTFSANDPKVAVSFFTSATGGFAYSGSAVESTSHLVLLMAGFTTDILVGRIEDPAAVPASGTWRGFSTYKQYRAVGGEYSIARDPHAVAAVLAAANSRSYGFLLSGSSALLMIDLQDFLEAEARGTTGDDARILKNTPFNGTIIRTLSLLPAAAPAASNAAVSRAQRSSGYTRRAR